MNWWSLIPIGLSLLGGITSGGRSTNSSRTALSPIVEKLAKESLTKAGTVYNKPYQAYPGERVPGASPARGMLQDTLGGIKNMVAQGNGQQGAISNLMGRQPRTVSAPTLAPQRMLPPPSTGGI